MTLQAAEAHGRQLQEIPGLIQAALPGWQKQIEALTPQLANSSTLLYLGRAAHYAIAREGALKLKESAYLNAEGYPAGELKHGPNALVSKDAPLIMIATADARRSRLASAVFKGASTHERHAGAGSADRRPGN